MLASELATQVARPLPYAEEVRGRSPDFFEGMLRMPSPTPYTTVAEAVGSQPARDAASSSSTTHIRPFVNARGARAVLIHETPQPEGASLKDLVKGYFLLTTDKALLTSEGLTYAKRYIASRPAHEQVGLFQKLSSELMDEVTSSIQSHEFSRDEGLAAIDRVIGTLVEKDIDADDGDYSYRDQMVRLIYFKNEHLRADLDDQQNLAPPNPDDPEDMGNQVLIANMER